MKMVSGIIVIICVALLLVGAGQLQQYKSSLNTSRTSIIDTYTQSNPDQKGLIEEFKSKCLKGLDINEGITKTFLSTYDCGLNIDATELTNLIKASDNSMGSIAFPLSIFAKE